MSDEHGIDFSNNEWVEGDINSAKPHGNPTILPTAKKLSISANKSGKSLSQLLEDGELQAIIGTGVPEAFGRNPDIVRLYPDYRAAEMEYYRRTKIFPIMHTVVIRRDVHDKHPFVATSLYQAFERGQGHRAEEDALSRHAALHAAVDDRRARRDRRGVRRRSLALRRRGQPADAEALVRYLAEQGVIAKAPRVDDLFVPVRQVKRCTLRSGQSGRGAAGAT